MVSAAIVALVGLFVVLLLLGLFAAYAISLYNQLVSLKKRVDQAKQNIDVLLKQRQDELTKIIDAVSEFMDHEEELYVRLTEAREAGAQAETPTEQANADQLIRNVMAEFDARKEDYPELRSASQFEQLTNRIADIENQIADRRELYNDAVTRWNTRIEQFPYVIIANQLGYQDRDLFTATEEEKQDVDVGEALA